MAHRTIHTIHNLSLVVILHSWAIVHIRHKAPSGPVHAIPPQPLNLALAHSRSSEIPLAAVTYLPVSLVYLHFISVA